MCHFIHKTEVCVLDCMLNFDLQTSCSFLCLKNVLPEKILSTIKNVEELQKKHGMPKESSIEEVASIIASASSISIITGAGVSAESGVFTYKESTET